MTPKVIDARHVHDFVLHVRFADGIEGDVDLAGLLDGPVFELLKDPEYFGQVMVHPELHTVVWPNGADLAPEFLYEQVRVVA